MAAEDHPFLSGPTSKHAVDVAIEMLSGADAGTLNMDGLLSEAAVSSGSLYYQFGNRKKFLAAINKERYRRLALTEDQSHLQAGFDAQTPEEFLDFISEQLRRIATDPLTVKLRQSRLQLMAAASADGDIAERTSLIQTNFFETISQVFEVGKQRGLINPELDSFAYCAWFHGMTLGRSTTELSLSDAQLWLDVAIPAALAPLRLPSA